VASVSFDDVAKVYPDGTRAVSGFDLEIADGEFMVLVGPSGSGKTTARVQLRAELARILNELGTTTIYVTHDQIEAMTMGDRVAVMRRGELEQVDTPQELYDRPVNLFVGGFIGSPAMNMVEATLEPSNGTLAAAVGSQRIVLGDEKLNAHPALRAYEGRTVILGIRPEDLEDVSLEPETPADRRLRGVAELREALGSELMVHFTVEGTQAALTEDVKELAQDAGHPGEGALESKGSGALLVGRFGPRASVEEGKPVEVAVDTRSLHFFDPETSEGIYDGNESQKGASA
jgi:multiple sugar transport system ATP-binding protein